MAIVTDRLTANRPPVAADPKGKVTPAALNNNKDLEVDMKKEEPSFFGSFFSSSKAANVAAKKKGAAAMEPVGPFALWLSCNG